MPNPTLINIQGQQMKLSNLEKILYPNGFTKGQMLDYYIRIAPTLLPYLAYHALTMKRYPHGIKENFFYQKKCPAFRPAWMKTIPIWSDKNREQVLYCTVNDLPSLVWVANLASIELHTSLSVANAPDIPTVLVFDLDPGISAGIIECCKVALLVREWLLAENLQSFPKASGSKGLQLYVPLNTPVSFLQTKQFAHKLAKHLEIKYPDLVVSKMSKALRRGKIFIDWSQNDAHKTTVCVYSLRATHNYPTVSAPLSWQEVEIGCVKNDPDSLLFTPQQVLHRIESMGDLFSPILSLHQSLSE